MTCYHGRDPTPLPIPFKDDDELRVWLGLPDTEKAREVVAGTEPGLRKTYAEMRAMAQQIEAGRLPVGVIGCDRKKRKAR